MAVGKGDTIALRQAVMALCAEAALPEIERAIAAVSYDGAVDDLRPPQTGLVMLRGRIGGYPIVQRPLAPIVAWA